ncbi:MAG: DEAD/DEAH box helicase [Flavobacteriales bacterium]|nr:DEAD/DEAH box helicase [Flavobacteriales bacterium]
MSFTSLGLSKSLLNILEEQGFSQAYPIQEQAIPVILKKKDVLGIAKTGSGKTASYVLPILENIRGKVHNNGREINVLVLVPTRELAAQVHQVFDDFASGLDEDIKTKAVFGGVSINPQMKSLHGVNVLVATPGRLLELVEKKAVSLSKVTTLVLDEADKMLNLGFREEMNDIFDLLPVKRQNLLFSATLNKGVDYVNKIILHDATVIKIEEENVGIELINQIGYSISEEKKGPLLRYLIKEQKMNQVLVFVSSIHKADNVVDKLKKNGIQALSIHGKKSMGARTEALRMFKTGKLTVLVATDLLARGIDIEFLPYVINYELPRSPKDYIHRIGRTGRAEASGDAISLVTPEDKQHFRVIQKKMKRWVTMIDGEIIDLKGY